MATMRTIIPVGSLTGEAVITLQFGRMGFGQYVFRFIDRVGRPVSDIMKGNVLTGNRTASLGEVSELPGKIIHYLISITDVEVDDSLDSVNVTITITVGGEVVTNGNITFEASDGAWEGFIRFE